MKTENLAGMLSLVCGTLAVPAFPNPSGAIGQYVGTWIATVVNFICIYGIFPFMSKRLCPDWTTIRVSGLTWRRLNGEKMPGESFDGTITRLIENNAIPQQRNE